MDEVKNDNTINKTQIIKQVKGISYIINNSSQYWKETFNDFENNFCQCGGNPEGAELNANSGTNPDANGNSLSDLVMNKRIDRIFTNKRTFNDTKNISPNNSASFNYPYLKTNKFEEPNEIWSSNYLVSTQNTSSNIQNSYPQRSNNFNFNSNKNSKFEEFFPTTKGENESSLLQRIPILELSQGGEAKNDFNNVNIDTNNKTRFGLENLLNNAHCNYYESKKIWTEAEDETLLELLKNSKRKNWKKISAQLKTKTPQQCSYRYNNILLRKNLKKFSRTEDILIIELIEKHGENWDAIAKSFPGRQKGEIIERYFSKLNPDAQLKKHFEPEEDALLLSLRSRLGNNWSEIAKSFKGKTPSMLKTRFYLHLKKTENQNIFFSSGNNDTITDNSGNGGTSKTLYQHNTNSFSDFDGKCEDENLTISDGSSSCSSKNNTRTTKKNADNFINNNAKQLSYLSNRGFIVRDSNAESIAKKYENDVYLPKKSNNEHFYFDSKKSKNENDEEKEDCLMFSPNYYDEKGNNADLNFDEFLKDFEKIDKYSSEIFGLENLNKDFLNDSYLINNYYNNSNFDCNSTSLLDLLEDENFSKDFLSRNSAKNSGTSLKYCSNNSSYESQTGMIRSGTNETRNSFISLNSIKNNLEALNFNSENIFSNNNNNKDNTLKNNNINNTNNFNFSCDLENSEKQYADYAKETRLSESKMILDDSEMLGIPNDFYRMEEDITRYSHKISEIDAETKNNFNKNYFKCFESDVTQRRSLISTTNSKEVIDKMRLENLNNLNYEANSKTNFNMQENNKIDFAEKINSETETETEIKPNKERKIRLNPQKGINRQLIDQYRLLQDVYKKYKQYKNLKIKIKAGNEGESYLNESFKKILNEEKRLNNENETWVKELIKFRNDYKKYAAEIKVNKNLKDPNGKGKDPQFLRNSLLQQIEILMQLIKNLKMKVDLIRNSNAEGNNDNAEMTISES